MLRVWTPVEVLVLLYEDGLRSSASGIDTEICLALVDALLNWWLVAGLLDLSEDEVCQGAIGLVAIRIGDDNILWVVSIVSLEHQNPDRDGSILVLAHEDASGAIFVLDLLDTPPTMRGAFRDSFVSLAPLIDTTIIGDAEVAVASERSCEQPLFDSVPSLHGSLLVMCLANSPKLGCDSLGYLVILLK